MIRCAVCLYTASGMAPEADTIINGQAVCSEHMGYVTPGEFQNVLRFIRELSDPTDKKDA